MTDRSNQTVDKKERGQATKRVRLLESDSDSDTEKENIPKGKHFRLLVLFT